MTPEKLNELKEFISDGTLEFDEKLGYLTVETSIHKDIIPLIDEIMERIAASSFGCWIINACDTCVGYNGEDYYHFSLEKFETIEKMKLSPGFIKVYEKETFI